MYDTNMAIPVTPETLDNSGTSQFNLDWNEDYVLVNEDGWKVLLTCLDLSTNTMYLNDLSYITNQKILLGWKYIELIYY